MNRLVWRMAMAAFTVFLVCALGVEAAGSRSSPLRVAQAAAAPEGSPQEAPPAPRIPTRTEILNFGSWVVTCSEFAEAPKRICSALLQITEKKSNQTVFSWTVGFDNNNKVTNVIQTPTGVAISPGVELRIGKTSPRKIPFASCESGRCVAVVAMDADLLHDMSASVTAEAAIQGSQGNRVDFNIDMKGC